MSMVRRIALWFFLSLAFALVSALVVAGKPTMLRHAAKIKPYAVAFQAPPPAAGSGPTNLIIFLGDSSVAQPPWTPIPAPRISALLADELTDSFLELGDTRVADWAFAGGRLFHYYCLLFEAEKHSPALVVVPINWRSIGPLSEEWGRSFAFPEISALAPQSERAHPSGATIMRMEGISPTRQRIYALQRPLIYVIGLKRWFRGAIGMDVEESPPEEILRLLPLGEMIIGNYTDERLFTQYTDDIPPGEPPLQALRSVVEAAERLDMKLLFYITPIHLEEMRRRQAFNDDLFQASVERVVEAARSETSLCLNLSGLLPERDFMDNYEHYTADGNRLIARALAAEAGEILKAARAAGRERLSARASSDAD
jgi:hypothetical protein